MVYLEVHSSSIMSVLQSRPGSFLLLVKDLLEYQDYAPNGSIYGSKWNMFNHVHTGSGFMQVQFFFLLVAELGRSGTLDVDRVLTHCSTSSRTSRDSKMPSASSDSGGYGQIMKSPFFWGGHFCSFGKETPVTVMTFSTEREQLSLDRWKIDPRCHENGTPLVARSPKVLQPVNPHRDVLRRRLAHGDSVSEARIPFDLHRFTTFKFSFESKAVIWEFVKPPRLFV